MEEKIPPIEKAYFKTNTFKSIYSTCPVKMTNGHIGWTLPVDKPLLGSLSSHLDDGGKTIAKLKKINLRLFKLKRVYSDPRKLSKVGGFSWS